MQGITFKMFGVNTSKNRYRKPWRIQNKLVGGEFVPSSSE